MKPSGKSTILENVMVQCIGQASGVVAAAAAFLVPALYINGLDVHWWQTFLACTIGGFLGDCAHHPAPEVLREGPSRGASLPGGDGHQRNPGLRREHVQTPAKCCWRLFGLGAAYDFIAEGIHAWNPMMTTATLLGGLGKKMSAMRSKSR